MQETQRLVREMADRENARIRDMEQAALAQRQGQELAANTHRELHNIYPDSFSGDFERDKPFLNTIANYAHSAGYFEQYGINSGAMRLAFLELMRGRQEMASPAAAALNAAANIEARPRPAAAVAPGSTTTSTPVKRAPVKPLTKDANGRFLSAKEYAEQVIRGLVPN